jgi:hypothetical protein
MELNTKRLLLNRERYGSEPTLILSLSSTALFLNRYQNLSESQQNSTGLGRMDSDLGVV